MSGLTGRIEQFLLDLFDQESAGEIQIGRNDLADQFDCAPSQINYVLSTRFTPYNGYYIESRRGGAGYIRIIRLDQNKESCLYKLMEEELKDEVTVDKARNILESLVRQGIITEREGKLLFLTIDNQALKSVPYDKRNKLRADLMKNALILFL